MSGTWQERCAKAAKFVGTVLVPPAFVAWAQLAEKWEDKYPALALAAITPPAVVYGADWMLAWLHRKSEAAAARERRTRAIRAGVDQLIKTLLSETKESNPNHPALRATAFVPENRDGHEERLYPVYRRTSTSDGVEFGEAGFAETRSFARGEAFCGKAWRDGAVYATFKAIEDFAPMAQGKSAFDQWCEHWQLQVCPGVNPQRWSRYIQHARSLWAFPIATGGRVIDGRVELDVIAVISVDSIHANAFRDLRDADLSSFGCPIRLSDHVAPAFKNISFRDAIQAGVNGVVLGVLGDTSREGEHGS